MIMVATYETEKIIMDRERQKGFAARQQGKPITDCPWNGGTVEQYWKEGWNGYLGTAQAQ